MKNGNENHLMTKTYAFSLKTLFIPLHSRLLLCKVQTRSTNHYTLELNYIQRCLFNGCNDSGKQFSIVKSIVWIVWMVGWWIDKIISFSFKSTHRMLFANKWTSSFVVHLYVLLNSIWIKLFILFLGWMEKCK